MRDTHLHKDVIAVVKNSDTPIQTPKIIRKLIGRNPNAPRFVDNLCDLILILQELNMDGTLQCDERGWTQKTSRNSYYLKSMSPRHRFDTEKRRAQKCKSKNGE